MGHRRRLAGQPPIHSSHSCPLPPSIPRPLQRAIASSLGGIRQLGLAYVGNELQMPPAPHVLLHMLALRLQTPPVRHLCRPVFRHAPNLKEDY